MSSHLAASVGDDWKVRPHGPLTEVDEKILTVTGEPRMPMELERRMTVVRLKGARLAIFSAVLLDEAEMCALEVYGRPEFLVVPNAHHRLDAVAWKQRYPEILVVAPEGARAAVAKKVHVDTCDPDFGDPDVQFIAVPGTDAQESALLVRSSSGTTLILNDLVGNMQGDRGLRGWVLRRMLMRIVEDTGELRGQLIRWGAMPLLTRIIVSHGAIIDHHPGAVLREVAASLE